MGFLKIWLPIICFSLYAISPAQADFVIVRDPSLSEAVASEAETIIRQHITENYTQSFLDRSKLSRIEIKAAIVLDKVRNAKGELAHADGQVEGTVLRVSLEKSLLVLAEKRAGLLAQLASQKAEQKTNAEELEILNRQPPWDCSNGTTAEQESCKLNFRKYVEKTRAIKLSNAKILAKNIKNIEEYMAGFKSAVAEVFDHELFHMVDRKVLNGFAVTSPWNLRWSALNPSEFSYSDDTGAFIAAHGADAAVDSQVAGFVRPYATTTIQEDRAETYCAYMSNPAKFMTEHGADPIIVAKVGVLREMLNTACDDGRSCEIPKKFSGQ